MKRKKYFLVSEKVNGFRFWKPIGSFCCKDDAVATIENGSDVVYGRASQKVYIYGAGEPASQNTDNQRNRKTLKAEILSAKQWNAAKRRMKSSIKSDADVRDWV